MSASEKTLGQLPDTLKRDTPLGEAWCTEEAKRAVYAPERLPQFENHAEQETHYTTCYMCACRCGIKATLENNKVRFIEGNRDHPVNKGVLCAKGAAGIMKQESPGKLQRPLRRVPGSERGEGLFEEVSWEQALDVFAQRLSAIRDTDPNRLAFFTGRDQMQALTGLWAREFGTLNWAAHGGFCPVNMAAAGLYTLGYSFWEFGEPDFDRTRYLMMWGVAEDHSSNPIKIGLEKVKRRGAKFVSVNPVRTGYSAIVSVITVVEGAIFKESEGARSKRLFCPSATVPA